MVRARWIAVVLLGIAAAAFAQEKDPIYGFTADSSRTQREWEAKFKALPSPQIIRETMQRLSARPHHVGSEYDKQNAQWILSQFQAWGLDAKIESYDVLFPTPRERLVELLEPTHFVAKLQEPAVGVDPTSNQQSEQLPTYNAYSIDGDVTGPLVYVNFGVPKDYEALDRLGISVKGAIVIARYGGSWRGIKPKVAAEHGAIGCIIYSDPHEDGFAAEKVFPDGPMRNEDGAQRGSVMDMPLHPGDPLTPGVAAKGNVKRLDIKETGVITKIPVLPISYGDAKPLLAALAGSMAPEDFRGGLPITYHIGPGPAKVHLKVASNWDIKPIYDVIARINGSESPDQWIIRGNHHDAWVNGAWDPISGQAPMLEEARGLAELVKQGWKPKRTIIFCAWDGEEPGLLGSTEWVEDHADELAKNAAIYVNTDDSERGFLHAEGSHALEKFVNGVAREINDPEKNISIWKRSQAHRLLNGKADEKKEARSRADLRIAPLGSGSDYTAFIDHVGVPSLNLSFSGEDPQGIYHSVYDDFYWFTHFADTEFVYERALAQTCGVMLMRFADADVLPYDFADFADTMGVYTKELKTLLSDKQEEIREQNKAIEENLFDAVSDPRHPTTAPAKDEVPPFLNFAPLENAAAAVTRSADRYKAAMKKVSDKGAGLSAQSVAALNAQLLQTERLLTSAQGLPRRPWFRHLIYAPGFYTGYGAKTIPGVREAIEQKQYAEAEAEIGRVAKALQDYANAIDAAAKELESIGN